jgi:cellulose synthase/poly-beta-1,6-N-acetylglucosamine synthase-like glycosyltransferase
LTAVIFEKRRGKISVLNDVVAMADSEILVFSDANTMLQPDSIRQMVRHYANDTIGCVSGQLVIAKGGGVSGEGLYWKYEHWVKTNESRLGFLIGCNGGIFSLRKHLFTPLPASTIVEDFVITLNVLAQGHKVVLEPTAIGVEPPCPSSRAELVRKVRIGAGNWQAISLTAGLLHPRHGWIAVAYWGHKVLRWCVPFFLITSLISNVILFDTHVSYQIFFEAQLAAIALSALAAIPRFGTRLPRALRPLTYFYLMNYSLLCGFVRFLTKTQRVTWDRVATPATPTEQAIY